MMIGKGDKRRASSISNNKYNKEHDRIFGGKKKRKEYSPEVSFDEYLNEKLKDPEYKKLFDKEEKKLYQKFLKSIEGK